ncbi:predicted protein [Plenodomus lingam JN3]|uniref:Predicted protein n=2 Tax=Leptosphaeria maculans TaxID=5022 RepID=E5A5K3_LEPMJ|nr:predicted protein [Plenodomus lingam JN3]CBX98901.1 predicted protein [Plenodomus lingam JN3]
MYPSSSLTSVSNHPSSASNQSYEHQRYPMALDQQHTLQAFIPGVFHCRVRFDGNRHALACADHQITSKLPLSNIKEEAGRFNVWSANYGVIRTEGAFSDHKLRDASHVRTRMLRLLQSLASILNRILVLSAGQTIPWEDLSASKSDSDDNLPHDNPSLTELGQLANEMKDVITCLMRLSIFIENPAPHDQFIGYCTIDQSHLEPLDMKHVRENFPSMDPQLASRLGPGKLSTTPISQLS